MATFIIIFGIIVFYVIEVVRGSDVTQYDCEVGWPAHLEEPKALSRQEFFGYLLPLVLAALGIPLIFMAPWWGFLTFSAALILFAGRNAW